MYIDLLSDVLRESVIRESWQVHKDKDGITKMDLQN